jgi:hypothetical protein
MEERPMAAAAETPIVLLLLDHLELMVVLVFLHQVAPVAQHTAFLELLVQLLPVEQESLNHIMETTAAAAAAQAGMAVAAEEMKVMPAAADLLSRALRILQVGLLLPSFQT